MKSSYCFLPVVGLVLASCESGGPASSGGYDPLNPAGSAGAGTRVVESAYEPGSMVEASMANTAFFREEPSGNAQADQLLSAGTPLRVISSGSGEYVKVERENGEVGFVPEISLISGDDGSNPADGGGAGNGGDGEYQVYPPSEGIEPEGGEGPDAPVVPPTIDPDAPDAPDETPGEIPPLPGDTSEEPDSEMPDGVEPDTEDTADSAGLPEDPLPEEETEPEIEP